MKYVSVIFKKERNPESIPLCHESLLHIIHYISFTHSFNKYLLRTFFVAGITLGVEAYAREQGRPDSSPRGAYILRRKQTMNGKIKAI